MFYGKRRSQSIRVIKNIIIAANLYASLVAVKAFAVGVGVTYPGGPQGETDYTYIQYISLMYSFAMKAAVALCTLMVVYAGYKYLTSRGDSGAINEAKDILVSTLMGAALLMLVILVGNIAGLHTSGWGI